MVKYITLLILLMRHSWADFWQCQFGNDNLVMIIW